MVFLASRGATHSARIFEVTCVLLSNERRRTDVRQIMRGETISRVPISVAAISHGFVAGACLVISRIYSPVSFLRLLFWFVLPVRLSFYIEVAPTYSFANIMIGYLQFNKTRRVSCRYTICLCLHWFCVNIFLYQEAEGRGKSPVEHVCISTKISAWCEAPSDPRCSLPRWCFSW